MEFKTQSSAHFELPDDDDDDFIIDDQIYDDRDYDKPDDELDEYYEFDGIDD